MDLNAAIQIAVDAHYGQVDKGGDPYILHPLRVMLSGQGEEERIVGVLHDVVEDTRYTLDELRHAGFSTPVIESLELLTRPERTTYNEYLACLVKDSLARRVKMYDLHDNLRADRAGNISERLRDRYRRALNWLQQVEAHERQSK
jgi:(p)ppGpp synthase/HD superfamily hydrolase